MCVRQPLFARLYTQPEIMQIIKKQMENACERLPGSNPSRFSMAFVSFEDDFVSPDFYNWKYSLLYVIYYFVINQPWSPETIHRTHSSFN